MMEFLPTEMVNEIIRSIDKPSLYSAYQVCKQWRRLGLKQIVDIKTITDFVRACKQGDLLSITRSKYNKSWLNRGLYSACRGGHKELVELMIAKGANNWNQGLYGACRGGHKELAELMIVKGTND